MRAPQSVTPTKLVSLFHRGVAEVSSDIEPYARQWAEHNDRAAARCSGRLWLAMGDSTVQSIGASTFDRGWVGGVLERLNASADEPWRLINISRYGAKCADIVSEQIPRLDEWGAPDLVTCGVGANDVLFSLRLSSVLAAFDDLLAALPTNALVSAVPFEPGNKGARLNAYLRMQAPYHGIRVTETWPMRYPGRNKSADGFHPNDVGYESAAEDVFESLIRFGLVDAPGGDGEESRR